MLASDLTSGVASTLWIANAPVGGLTAPPIFQLTIGRKSHLDTPQADSGVQPQNINRSVSALRFFFTITLDRSNMSHRFVRVRCPLKLPTVLNVEEVGRLLEMAPRPKYRAALGTAYGAGLRCSTALGGLCREASVQPVARRNRSSATRSYRQLPGWIPPPMVNRTVGAH
jgi:hypothetical protein